VVRQLAAGLGVELDEVTQTYVREPAPEDFDPSRPATSRRAAPPRLRFEVRGMNGAARPPSCSNTSTRLARRPAPGLARKPAQEGRLLPPSR